MNLNLPSNLFYLKDNFTVDNPCQPGKEANASGDCVTIDVCERGKYRPKSGGGCIDAPMSGDRGYFVFADLVISVILLIHATLRWTATSSTAPELSRATAYFFLSVVGFLMIGIEMWYFLAGEDNEDAEEKDFDKKEDKENEAAAAKLASAAEIEAARLAAEQAGNDTNTTDTAFSQSVEAFTLSDKDYFGNETTKVLFGLRLINYGILALTIGLSIFSIPKAV
tara:strand:- start:157 stop:828 length:672 start_codon:yes stop_codon:yes gene_type:complete